MVKRVLFFCWPVGAGHTGRSIELAKILKSLGYHCAFAQDPSKGGVERSGFDVINKQHQTEKHAVMPKNGYLAIPSVDAAFSGIGLYRHSIVNAQTERDRQILEAYKPDLVVTHMQPTAVLAARKLNIPVVSIADADFLWTGLNSWMPWLEEKDIKHIYPFPSVVNAFNQLLSSYGLKTIADASEVFDTEIILIPSVQELDDLPDPVLKKKTNYIGPLIWWDTQAAVEKKIKEWGSRAGGKRIYVSVGSGEVSSRAIVDHLKQIGLAEGWQFVISDGYQAREGDVNRQNSLHVGFGGLFPSLDWCDLAVCHGGHSTIVAALSLGKPLLILPSMSENEANGRLMVEANQAGLVAWKSGIDSQTHRLSFAGGSRMADSVEALAGELSLSAPVNECLNNVSIRENARLLSAKLRLAASNQVDVVREKVNEVIG